tara:strand:- start:11936 stop:12667 length:732 start_codon:yes stop_codon:yes gene_type:complete
MSENKYFQFSNNVISIPLVLVLTIWSVYLIEIRLGINFNKYGILPRSVSGLRGIILSPFIHGSAKHLYNNTIPLFVLTSSLIYFYRHIAIKILIFGVLVSGFLTWCIGRESYHIGASGLIYVLASFIFFKGVFTKHYRLVALSLVVVFIYGSMLWYIFPIKDEISWEGHLSGFVIGLFFAIFIKVPVPSIKKFDWEREDYNEEDDEFLKHFDAHGNFIERKPEPEEEIKITYHYKPDKDLDKT